VTEEAKPRLSIGAWLNYAWAWAKYLFTLLLILAGIGLTVWYGYTRAGWLGIAAAIMAVIFVSWLFTDDNFERLLSGVAGVIALLLILGLIVGAVIGVGYLLGIGMNMAR
jgi:hypothetical protein